MGKLKVVIIILCLSMFITTANAQDTDTDSDVPQDIRFTHLSLEDGLSDNRVMIMEQDHQGFIWIGTQRGGLNRYDGYEFTIYRSDRNDETSISNNFIWSMFEDSQNNLWVGTNGGGLNLYDRATDSFIRFPNDESGIPQFNIKTIAEDADGTLWVGGSSPSGFSKFNRETGEFFHYQLEVDDDGVRDIHQDRETGLLWLGTYDHGILLFDSETEEFVENYPFILDDMTTLSSNLIQQITQNRNGDIWITTNNGLNRFNRDSETFTRYFNDPDDPASLSDSRVKRMVEDRHGRFWISSGKGLNLYHPDSDTFTTYNHDPDDPTSLSGRGTFALFEDDSGALWVGVNGEGVSRASGEPAKFNVYRSSQNNPNSLSGNRVRYLYAADKDNIWIGANGVNHFDGRNFTRYIHDPDDPTSLSHNLISAIVEDPRGGLWITTDNGLNYFDGETFTRYMHDPNDPDSLGGPIAVGVHLDDRGGLWIAVYDVGMDYFDGERFIHFRPGDDSGITSRWPYLITEDAYDANRVWVATFGDIMEIDLETQIFTHIFPTEEMLEMVPANQFITLYQEESGLLWVGGGESGLLLFDPDTQEAVKQYTTSDGLADNSVTGIVGDEQGYLWISTNNGLSQFNPETETFRNFYASDGLQGNQLTTLAIAPDGQIFVGGTGGLSAFYPEQIQDNPTIPPVVLTGFELFNEPVEIGAEDSPLSQAINTADELVLSHDQSVFTFEFSALNYSVPERNQYAYRMEGFDDDWRYTTSDRRFATYTNLDPGNYTFRVIASNNDGIWNEEGVSLKIKITPPWWQTSWAYALYAIGAIGSVFGVIQWRVQRIGKQKRQLEQKILVQKKQAEERENLLTQIQQESQRVTGVINAAHAGVWLLDGENRVILSNPIGEKLLATLANAQVGDRILKVGDRPIDYILTSPPEGLWHEIVLANQYIELIARPIENGIETQNWVVVVRDVTRDHEMRKQVEDHDRLATIGQMAAGIAHDFNNILAVINMRASIIQRQLEAQPKLQDGLGVIHTQVYRATDLIEQILDFSRRSVMERKPLELGAFLKEVVKLLDRTMPENIQINVSYGADKYVVNADLTRIQQVIMNLVINASHALVDGGDITLGLEHISIDSMMARKTNLSMGKAIKFTVSDTGEGISPENINHLFDPFFTTKAPGKGTGLGLAQVHGIVNQHDGYIEVASKLGEGTTFTIYLPALITSSTISATLEDVQSIKQGEGQTILVVEDNSELRAVLIESLQDLNYKVMDVANGFEAITTLLESDSEIELVLSDIVMPKMGGVAMFHAMQEQGISKPVIFMTGHLLADQMNEILEELAIKNNISWLKKPLNIEILAQRINDVFAKL